MPGTNGERRIGPTRGPMRDEKVSSLPKGMVHVDCPNMGVLLFNEVERLWEVRE